MISEANTQNVGLIFGPYQKHIHKHEMSEPDTQNVGLYRPHHKHTHKLEMSEPNTQNVGLILRPY